MIGEITGGDRALVSSLEGFEDLQIIGRRQMESYGIHKDDVVFSVTEGGETSSVIGVILATRAQCADEKPEVNFGVTEFLASKYCTTTIACLIRIGIKGTSLLRLQQPRRSTNALRTQQNGARKRWYH